MNIPIGSGPARRFDAGGDPLEAKQAERAAPDMGELLDEYLEAAAAKRSLRDDRSMIETVIRPRWKNRKAASITLDDVEVLHRELTKGGTPIRANRVLSCLSTIFAVAIKRRMTRDNPCRGVGRNPETKRTRYLSLDELGRLTAALDGWPDQVSAGAIRLLLLTGARRGELLKAHWPEFDLVAGLWTKPARNVKSKREHRLPLSAEAVEVLRSLPRYERTELLFPNSYRKPWTEIAARPAIRSAAGLGDFRLHDLRHTGASLMISAGLSLPIVGSVLGHSTPQTTQRYSHLADHAVRAAVDGLGRRIGNGNGGEVS